MSFKDYIFRPDLNPVARLTNTQTGRSVILVEHSYRFWWITDDKVIAPPSIGPTFRQLHKALIWGMTVWDCHEPHMEVEPQRCAACYDRPYQIGVVDPDGKPRTLRLACLTGFSVRFLDADTGEALDWAPSHHSMVLCLADVFKAVGHKGVIPIDMPRKIFKNPPNWGRPYYEVWGYDDGGPRGPYVIAKYEQWGTAFESYDDLGKAIIDAVNKLAKKGCTRFKIVRND